MGPASAKASSRDNVHKHKSKRTSQKAAGAKSSTQRRSKCSDLKSNDESHQELCDENGEPKTDNVDVKKLISMQFEQAQMLMDLQKQFLEVQEIEEANEMQSVEPAAGTGAGLSSERHAEVTEPSAKRPGHAETSTFIEESDGHISA